MPEDTIFLRSAGVFLIVSGLAFVLGSQLEVGVDAAPDNAAAMQIIAQSPTGERASHQLYALSYSSLAVAALFVFVQRSGLTHDALGATGWAILAPVALLIMIVSVTTATAVTNAAVAGNADTFERWYRVGSAGWATLAFEALALALICLHGALRAGFQTLRVLNWVLFAVFLFTAAGLGGVLMFGIDELGVLAVGFLLIPVWKLGFGATMFVPRLRGAMTAAVAPTPSPPNPAAAP